MVQGRGVANDRLSGSRAVLDCPNDVTTGGRMMLHATVRSLSLAVFVLRERWADSTDSACTHPGDGSGVA